MRSFAVSLLTALLLTGCIRPASVSSRKEPLLIDERDQQAMIEEVIPIDSVWAGHRVGFALFTAENRQYIAYYNADRHTVVGQRNLGDAAFDLHTLPPKARESREGTSTILEWDSHNYLTLAVDKAGFIHLSGNMHVNGLTYFRSTRSGDIASLVQVDKMVGTEENRCTYPRFIQTADGELIFRYRDGGSGNGNDIYNVYSTANQQWTRLIDVPLTDGQGERNAYSSAPELRPDNWYHMYWVWRETPDCSTNHDLSYIKSPDMRNWYNVKGEAVELPVTFDNTSVIVDPIPVKGGIINLAARLCFDAKNRPIFAYHKYDSAGNLQFYAARFIDDAWQIHVLTAWDYRWEFSGGGSINNEVLIGAFNRRDDGYYELGYTHVKYGTGTLLLDKDLKLCGTVRKPPAFEATLPVAGDFPGLAVRTAGDLGQSPDPAISYVLKWESLPANRDKPRPQPWPAPSQLSLYHLRYPTQK